MPCLRIIIINYFKLYNITTLGAKCRIDSFWLTWTGSICHIMLLLNVEFSNTCRFRVFQCHFSTVSRFHSRVFSHPVLTRTNRVLEVARIYTTHSKWCDKFFVLTMFLYTFISLLYKQLLQYTLFKTFTVPSALLTKFAKKSQTKFLAAAFDFTKLSTKTLLLWRCHVSFEYPGLLQNTPASFLLFLSMLKLHYKRHYRNLATYSWRTTWREHVTQKNGAGATPTFGRRRRRRRADQLRSAAAVSAKCRRRRRGGGGAQL